jgi:hypothetical protein
MVSRRTILFPMLLLICTALTMSSCRPQAPTPANTSIGKVTKVSDTVEKNNSRVLNSNQLFQNDSVGLLNGGEGLLDFGGALILRLFNDTQVGGVEAVTDPNSSVFVRLRLRLGGFTGKLNKPGKQAVFETPNGAKITVSGTDFFLVYDPEQDLASAGNFNGDMEIEAGGSGPVPIPPGTLRQAQGNNPPSPEAEIPFGKSGFEDLAREFGSPVTVVNERVSIIGEPLNPDPGLVDKEPPGIVVQRVVPETLLIGPECPDEDQVVQITYTILDESEVVDTTVEWELRPHDRMPFSGPGLIEKIDDMTFLAFVGPFDAPGFLGISFSAVDSAGNVGNTGPMTLEVVKCIG